MTGAALGTTGATLGTLVLAAALVWACRRPPPPGAGQAGAGRAPPARPAGHPLPGPLPAPTPPPVPTGSQGRGPAEGPGPADDDTLVGEQRDRDPRSQSVTIELSADPRRKARVFWGRKDLGLAPLQIQRPRGSGPLDLVVVAPGCLTLHTRAFTDRDDRIALRLYAESEASGLLGYRADERPPPAPAPAPAR